MALSPSIPTSFVPKQPVAPSKRPRSSGNNIFFIVSLIIGLIAVAGAAAVYLYSAYLTNVEKSKAAQVQAAENAVDPDTVQQFVRLRDRLTAADMVLNQHVELSQFFSLLESTTLQNVHYDSLDVTVNDDRSATISLVGEAADFNALAAQSAAFNAQKQFKDVIISGINVGSNGQVDFTVNATLDPSIVIESAPPSTPTILPAPASAATASSTATSLENASVQASQDTGAQSGSSQSSP